MVGAAVFVTFVILASLGLWIVIGAKGPWWWKAIICILYTAFGFMLWSSLSSYRGWPAPITPPKNSIFIAGEINEPDPLKGNPGSIYLWVVPLDQSHPLLGYDPSQYEPRAYKEPYTEKLHQAVVQAQALQRSHGQGALIGLKLKKVRTQTGIAGTNGQRVPKWAIRPYVLPKSTPPQKGTP